ncbi:RHS repeat domain-containing protein [Parafrigoribacterium soli]|uniref:RHS repeat domain-containing protein n=1 Tax=Parafrigoribacterium soli TaxID=3144663 RepID=UPI0032F03BCE
MNADVPIGATFNSRASNTGSVSNLTANGWTFGFAGTGGLATATGGVAYTGGDGSTWLFVPVAGSATAFTSPAGLNASLVATVSGGAVTGYTLTYLTSRTVVTIDGDGSPTSVTDKNGNAVAITNSGGAPTTVVAPAGPSAARTATVSYSTSTHTTTISQANGALTRNVKYVKDSNSNLTSFVDAEGQSTTFTYYGGRITSITSAAGAVTNISYGSTGKVVQVDQLNTSSGSPGTSTTRLSYPSGTQTLMAGPDTSTGTGISAGPHTTYTIGTGFLVSSVTDPMGRQRAATYNPANLAVATATSGTGTSAGTTTATYGANSGQSLTSVAAPGGATNTAAYANTSAASQYLPSSTTDDAGNSTTFTYNGAGNALTSQNTALAATATLTYNTDGTVATAAAPGKGTNVTSYGYNSNHQLVTVTPPTGTSLGVKSTTYDGFGRVATTTDGTGVTVTYGYDKIDRLLSTTFSGSTHSVVNTYDHAGRITSRVDGLGTTTYTYDQLGRLTARRNTVAGGTINYGYDKASNLLTTTDSRGTTTNAFDTSGTPTQITYVHNAGTQVLGFATDNRGRRTDEWLQTDPTHAYWSAHTHTNHDTTGRVTEVIAQTGPSSTSNTTVMDVTYCYNSATPAPTCGSATASDHSKLQWSKDNLSGQVTAYSYDAGGRLTGATQSGGTGANTYAYTYDANGNRLTATVTGATPSSQTFTANAANQITSTGYSYDGAGNLTADTTGTNTYNGAEQMTSVTRSGGTYSYTYAGASQNEVLSETTPTHGSVALVYGRPDQQGQPVVEQVILNGTATGYVEHDPVTGQPLMLRTSSGIESLYVFDGTGNPAALITDYATQAYAYSFDPYGTAILTAGGGGGGEQQNPYLFKGGIQDRTTGWVHFGARWYNPTTGRFTQQDTLDTPLSPANANRYAYAGGDPLNNLDPSGEGLFECVVALVEVLGSGLIAGAAILAEFPTAGLDTVATVGASLLFIAAAANAGYVCGKAATE